MKLMVEVTWDCPAACPYCLIPKNKLYMTPSDAARVFRVAADVLGEYTVVLTGGEPSVHPKLREIVDAARKYADKVVVSTNAYQPSVVVNAAPDEVEVSIDYADPRHDEWKRVPLLLAHALKLLDEAVSRGMRARVVVVLTKRNVGEPERIRRLLDSRGLDSVEVVVKPVRGAKWLLPPEDALRSIRGSRGIRVEDECTAGYSQLAVTPSLNLLPCQFNRVVLGSLDGSESLAKALEEARRLPRYACNT